MHLPRLDLAVALLLLSGCAAAPAAAPAAQAPGALSSPASLDEVSDEPWAAPALARAISVRDGRSGAELSLEQLLDELSLADAVFLGETHNDETTHRVELAVYEGLLARRQGDVVLAMEMFERDVQADLDAYLAGRIDEAAFLERARPWGNYRSAYRPLIERARMDGRPVVASNFPRPLRMQVAMQGLDALESAAPGQAPAEVLANTPAYWRRSDNAVRGHLEMMRLRDNDDPSRLAATQTLWDNAMGEACALALEQHPGSQVLHLNGGFHTLYWDGTVRQMLLRRPGTSVKTVSIVPSSNPSVADVSDVPGADYVIFAEARAADQDNGHWSVMVPRPLKYRLHLPAGADSEHPVPLLIWLGDDGLTAEDGLALWRQRLGDECALAVIQPPYLETQFDLSIGGRWFWADSFPSDIGVLIDGIERTYGYLLRNQPIDRARVCLAGEGTGATVVAATALLTGRLQASAVAFLPRHYTKLKDFPLPLPELRGADAIPDISLRLQLGPRDRDWWQTELEAYAGIGFDAQMLPAGPASPAANDAWNVERRSENALRAALGLEPKAPLAAAPPAARNYMVVSGSTPRAQHWTRLAALRHAAQQAAPVALLSEPSDDPGLRRVSLEVRPEDYLGSEEHDAIDTLPACPGPFGGTTLLVLGPDIGPAQLAAWKTLQEQDPLKARNRFRRLRLASSEPGRSLPEALGELLDAGRENVLIVPATFCAEPDTMRALKRSVADLEDRMTLHWLPGLGGS